MKALTREDLMYILQSIFRLSATENNAFTMLVDGLYVEDYHKDLNAHSIDTNLHIESFMREILEKLSVNEHGDLLYDTKPVNIAISQEEKNGIQVKADGIYVKDITQETEDHIADSTIHVTKENKESWDSILDSSKEYTDNKLMSLPYSDMKIVQALPLEDISTTTIYLLKDSVDCPKEIAFLMYVYVNDEWLALSVSNQTLDLFATKIELESYLKTEDSHEHANKSVIDELTESDTGSLLYKGKDIQQFVISDVADNAAKIIDDKLYVKDHAKEIESLMISAAFAKKSLLKEECAASGVYKLWDVIDNYNLILIEYYYKPDDAEKSPGNAKTAIIDTDTMNELYEKGIDYMLELGYGISTSNSKIRMNKDTLWVNYYHNVCIYKITGIRRGDE